MGVPDGVTLRAAVVDDARPGARLHQACWRESYGPITEPALLAAHLADEDTWVSRWRQQLEQGSSRLLAVTDDDLIGFADAGPGRDGEAKADLELYALYVRSAWHGTGVGGALLDATLGDAAAYLWVLEDNARAQAFYRRQGFVPDGGRERYEPLSVWEIRMVRPSRSAQGG